MSQPTYLEGFPPRSRRMIAGSEDLAMIHAAQVSPIASAVAWERSMFRPVHAEGLDPATQHGYKKAGAPTRGMYKEPALRIRSVGSETAPRWSACGTTP